MRMSRWTPLPPDSARRAAISKAFSSACGFWGGFGWVLAGFGGVRVAWEVGGRAGSGERACRGWFGGYDTRPLLRPSKNTRNLGPRAGDPASSPSKPHAFAAPKTAARPPPRATHRDVVPHALCLEGNPEPVHRLSCAGDGAGGGVDAGGEGELLSDVAHVETPGGRLRVRFKAVGDAAEPPIQLPRRSGLAEVCVRAPKGVQYGCVQASNGASLQPQSKLGLLSHSGRRPFLAPASPPPVREHVHQHVDRYRVLAEEGRLGDVLRVAWGGVGVGGWGLGLGLGWGLGWGGVGFGLGWRWVEFG